MPQIPALFQPWPPEPEPDEYDVIFIPNENFETNQLHGVNDMGDETTFTYDDGSTFTYNADGSTTVTSGDGYTENGITILKSDGSAETTTTDATTGNQTTTTVNPKTGAATQVTTGVDANGIVGIINSVTKVVQAVKGTGVIGGSNIYPQANGTVITRNANGTLTTFDPRTGQTSTTTLPSASGGLLSGNNLLIIGVLAIGALALSKRK